MSSLAERIRIQTLEGQAQVAMHAANSVGKSIRAYMDADAEPPPALVASFLEKYGEAERLYFEFLMAKETDDIISAMKPPGLGEVDGAQHMDSADVKALVGGLPDGEIQLGDGDPRPLMQGFARSRRARFSGGSMPRVADDPDLVEAKLSDGEAWIEQDLDDMERP